MKLKFCSCRACKAGRHRNGNKYITNYVKRAAKHKIKIMLKKGNWEDLPEAISIPYTD